MEVISREILTIGFVMTAMYFVVCRTIAREVMRGSNGGRLLVAFWAVGIVVFGTFMQLTVRGGENPWVTAALFVAPLTACMALVFFAQNR